MKTKETGENIYKMLNTWLRNFRSILAFMKKEIKDTKSEIPEGKCLESSWAVFNSIFMNNKVPSHTLEGLTFFFIIFVKKFIIQITWNLILYHWHASPAINYGAGTATLWQRCDNVVVDAVTTLWQGRKWELWRRQFLTLWQRCCTTLPRRCHNVNTTWLQHQPMVV